MPIRPRPIPWGAYSPDLSDINTAYTSSILNVLPRADGYQPFYDFSALTDALAADCRGFFFARNAGQLTVFAGTSTKLYKLNNTTLAWDDASQGSGTYAALSSDAQWQFIQFNDLVVAVQENVAPQVFDTTSDTEFADLGGSPPQAAYVSVINRFLVLSGLLDNPYRIQWSGLNEVDNWTSGTNFSDFQDLPDGGVVRGVVGGEYGVIIQDLAMRRMIYSPGSDVVFQIDRISKDTGVLAPYSIVNAGERVFFISPRGFVMTDASGQITPIGKERFDRTFLDEFDSSNLQLVIGASDPAAHLVYWSYKSADGGQDGLFDKIICYDWALDRWTPIKMTGQYLAQLASPGKTLEGLDYIAPGKLDITGAADNGGGLIRITVASTSTLTDGGFYTLSDVGGVSNANGTFEIDIISGTTFDLVGSTFSGSYTSGGIVGGSMDAMTISFDNFAISDLPKIAIADSDNKLGFFSGDTLAATLETSEITDIGFRTFVNGMIPLTDASSVSVSIAMRDNLNDTATYGEASDLDPDGYCAVLDEGRYLRAKLSIPAGTVWTYTTGIVPDSRRVGML